jgi:hypothetical protein
MEAHGEDGVSRHPAEVAVLVNASALRQKRASLFNQPLPFFEPEEKRIFLEKVDPSEGAHRLARSQVQGFRAMLEQENVCHLSFAEWNLHGRPPN